MYQEDDTLRTGLPPASDRMLTTCFLAALFHGIIILGVTFNSPGSKVDGSDAPALEVILVNDQGNWVYHSAVEGRSEELSRRYEKQRSACA